MRHAARDPVGVDECVPKLVVEGGIGGREAEGSFVGRDRVREPARGREGVAKAKVRGGVGRVAGEHGPIVREGGFGVSGRDLGAGHRRAQLGAVGVPAQRRRVVGQCRGEAATARECRRPVEVRVGVVGAQPKGAA